MHDVESLHTLLGHTNLSYREQIILAHRFILGNTYREIADIIRVSTERARCLERCALYKIRETYKLIGVTDDIYNDTMRGVWKFKAQPRGEQGAQRPNGGMLGVWLRNHSVRSLGTNYWDALATDTTIREL